MSLRQLYMSSPLGCVGMFLLGVVFSSQFGMAAIFGTIAELRLAQISSFVVAFYVGAIVLQYPIGWFSDRMDRRLLIALVSVLGTFPAVFGDIRSVELYVLATYSIFNRRHFKPALISLDCAY